MNSFEEIMLVNLTKEGFKLYNSGKFLEAAVNCHEVVNMCGNENDELKKQFLAFEGFCLARVKNYDKAIELFDESMSIDSEYDFVRNCKSSALNSQGKVLYDNNKLLEAAKKFEDALELRAALCNQKFYYSNLGNCYLCMGDYTKAIEIYDKSLNIDIEFIQAKEGKASALFKLGSIKILYEKKHLEAFKMFEEAIEISTNPESKKEYYAYYGYCYKCMKKYSKAIEMYDEVLSIDNEDENAKKIKSEILIEQGRILITEEKNTEAMEKIQEAIKLSNDSSEKKEYLTNLIANLILE